MFGIRVNKTAAISIAPETGAPATTLAGSRFGRVLLHSLCMLKRPNRLRWHWRGIVREFA